MFFFFFKQKTAYEMRISDWSSDVCSSDLKIAGAALDEAPGKALGKIAEQWRHIGIVKRNGGGIEAVQRHQAARQDGIDSQIGRKTISSFGQIDLRTQKHRARRQGKPFVARLQNCRCGKVAARRASRSEEHTSELQSLLRISYAVFC